MTGDWTPTSWQSKSATQQAIYSDPAALCDALDQLAKLPPLVTSWEVETLKRELGEAATGKRFLLQGGDCSESFDDCESSCIANKLKILLQMSLVLVYGCGERVIRVGRFAGQYAKPRSAETETRDGITLPSYRGNNINRAEFTEADRKPDPQLLLRGYERAALSLNFIRSLIDGGFADLHHPEFWDLGFMSHSPRADEYHIMAKRIGESIKLMETIAGESIDKLNRVEFYTSHEGLHLLQEQAQTRQVPRRAGWYNLATHLPWIGARTCDIEGAHVEYFRGIQNPIGLKVGPATTPEQLAALIDVLNANNEPGRLTLIHRFGADQIEQALPPLIDAARNTGKIVLWCCDPMHGNTVTTDDGYKTRRFDAILDELVKAFAIHKQQGSILGGVHFELTGDNVTECTGGARGLADHDLKKAYKTQVDPRLNAEQSLEMAMLIARTMGGG